MLVAMWRLTAYPETGATRGAAGGARRAPTCSGDGLVGVRPARVSWSWLSTSAGDLLWAPGGLASPFEHRYDDTVRSYIRSIEQKSECTLESAR